MKMNKKIAKVLAIIFAGILNFPYLALADWNISSVPNAGLPKGEILAILTKILTWLSGILGLLGVLSFVIAGIMYVTAAGNTEQIEKAKKTIQWSIVGIVVGLSGYIILSTISGWLTGGASVQQ